MTGGKTVVELRVHGVSGTPPEVMLNCPAEFLDRVSGDPDAAFFRRATWIDDAISPPSADGWRRRMEAYSWGGLTSRRASRALWLLFLPFSLINLAHWMLPPARRRGPAVVVVALLRLLALSFTLTLLLAMAVAVLDIALWQCASVDYCRSGWLPLEWLGGLSPGRRLALGALPLAAVIVALWLLGRQEAGRATPYDGPDCDDAFTGACPPPSAVVSVGEGSPLVDTTFWNHDDSVARMRACHVTAWTAALAALVLAAPVADGDPGRTRDVSAVLLGVNLGVLGMAVGATAWNRATGRGGDGVGGRLHAVLMRLRWVALILLGLSLAWLALGSEVPVPRLPDFLPGLRGSIYALLAVQVILLAGVFVGSALSMRGGGRSVPAPGYGMTLRGFTAAFVALLGWLIGGGISVGVGLSTALVLGTVRISTADAAKVMVERTATLANAADDFAKKVHAVTMRTPLIVPPPYVWASVATLLVLFAAVATVVRVWRAATGTPPQTEVEAAAPRGVLEAVRRARAAASLTDAGPAVIAGLATLAFGILVVMAVLFFPDLHHFTGTRFLSGGVSVIAMFVPIALVVGLVVLVAQASRNRQMRRAVSILWDVITFWPRATHPLTPPSYGGRTVWDLRTRMDALVHDPQPTRVVLVAHSQGTVIAAATLMQCTRDDEHYPLLTFGAPLRRLYARNFPAYFGAPSMDDLRRQLARPEPRWINLWALTDPIGSWVFDPGPVFVQGPSSRDLSAALATVDTRILDVRQRDPEHGDFAVDPDGAVCGHSGFWDRVEYRMAVEVLQSLVVDEDVDGGAVAPPVNQAM
ncbi:hypothetical protein [Mycolicibacterium psychrotolerans]|uniref:Integral membrane protein n=1 Tax=Mycolicibacterium psychrotolerans TaxID=216929 RepID=A0A7I7M679_9MYCO|nr:hypothetical protein [Mycolicibacterium psychrotolerans]BBX67695.1 hypothetical protein MPSYJ_11560 [Mycolicibacterium psychrotolerans]